MGTSRLFMPLLTELGGWEIDFAINMSRLTALWALERPLFNKATFSLCGQQSFTRLYSTAADKMSAGHTGRMPMFPPTHCG